MPKIDTITLRCANLKAQRSFYCDVLRMDEFEDGSVGYGGEEARLFFQQSERDYIPAPNDLYWKIVLAVPNIELAYQQLTELGIEVGTPRQFRDIGYIAHFSDPAGFTIELIDHWFQGNRPDEPFDTNLLGGGAHLNLLTLRSIDIEDITRSCLDWGMKLLAIEPVESHGFTLYFFAYTADVPPSSDLHAVENREWLYQRKYTVLEIQHLHDGAGIRPPRDGKAGYVSTTVAGMRTGKQIEALCITT